MSINVEKYGEHEGRDVYKYTLDNGNGLVAEILNYGGIIVKLVFRDTDVVLGRNNFDEYLDNKGYFGALIGRNSNRIENAEFILNEKTYKVCKNKGEHNLHGGKVGFDKRVWDAETVDAEEPALILTLTSPDGEEGFPGEVKIKVTYTLTKDDAIAIHYEGEADADTVLNMTNHTYFNLNGHNQGTVDNHKMWMNSSFYTPNNADCIPVGEVVSVKGTPFDLRETDILKDRFTSSHEQIKMFSGFDHNFVIDGMGYRLGAVVTGDKSGISMEMYTDNAGVQLYTGNSIDENTVGKDGAVYSVHSALCLETQSFPNGLKYTHFPNGFLKKGEKYDTVTVYKFK